MPVLERSALQASPLADLHAIADQLGLEGFRRLRKAELIDAILGDEPGKEDDPADSGDAAPEDRAERDSARTSAAPEGSDDGSETPAGGARRRRRPARSRRSSSAAADAQPSAAATQREDGGRERSRGGTSTGADAADAPADAAADGAGRTAEGVVELLGNGSAFLRVAPPDASDEDVYISAAQVRRCELVSGDRVTGPVRTPRRSERYPSLVRIDTINGAPAGAVSDGARYDERPVAYPSERFALDAGEPTLDAIEWLTPFGRGSRVVIAGPARAGKTEILRALLGALAGREGYEITLVLAGVRPEEIGEWAEGPVAPAAALSFATSADAQSQAVERALDPAKRTAARGGHALVLIDTLDGLHPHAARKVLAAARSLRDGDRGSLTIIATATRPLGGETTVIALDPALALSGAPPLDLAASGTIRAELLVGEDGAAAIAQARASAGAQTD